MPRPPDHDEELIRAGLAVKTAGLGVSYGDAQALLDMRFEARAGEVTVVSGPTGGGKSTLLRVLKLSLAPQTGALFLFGADAARLSPARRVRLRRRIGVVEDYPALVEEWTAADNVALPLMLAGQARRATEQDVDELLSFVGLAAEADAPAASLSQGQRKQLALARALVAKPDLILADEPAAGFSPEVGGRVLRVLAEMRKIGAAVIITTQDPDLADDMGAAHWRLERGRMAQAAFTSDRGP